jgi:hypothetical protein
MQNMEFDSHLPNLTLYDIEPAARRSAIEAQQRRIHENA